jgi:hypothetical protein
MKEHIMDIHGKFALVFASLSAFFVLSVMVVITTYLFVKKQSRYGGAGSEFSLGKFTNKEFNSIGGVVQDSKREK